MTVTIDLNPKPSAVDVFGDEIEQIADDIYMNSDDADKLTKNEFITLFAYNTKYSSVARMVVLHTVEMQFEGKPADKKKKVMKIVRDLNKIVDSVLNRNGRWVSQ